MREKPPLPDERIVEQIRQEYALQIASVEFLPLGFDVNSAVYRVVTRESVPYFLKLRKNHFDERSLLVPQFLHERGIRQVIPPQKTKEGRLWARLEAYTCILYPFIDGRDGFEVQLSDEQWVEFGAALKGIHSAILPPDLRRRIPSETYSSRWRDSVMSYLAQVEQTTYADPVGEKTAAFLRDHREEIRRLVERAGELASDLQSQPLERVLCHADIHAGNLLLAKDGSLYIVDWDDTVLAPKERDLMFIGGGVGDTWNTEREEDLFYHGYYPGDNRDQGHGPADINLAALAYYQYERIVQDIAEFCNQILSTDEGGEDREQAYRYLTGQFMPGDVLEIAYRTDEALKEVTQRR